MSNEEMAKKRAVIDYIVSNKLSEEEAQKYMEEEGVTVRTLSYTKLASVNQEEQTPDVVAQEETTLNSEFISVRLTFHDSYGPAAGITADRDETAEWLRSMGAMSLPIVPPLNKEVGDLFYQLEITNGFNQITFQWWPALPETWEALTPIVKLLEEKLSYESGHDRFVGHYAEELPEDEIDEEVMDRVWAGIATQKKSDSYIRTVLEKWALPIIATDLVAVPHDAEEMNWRLFFAHSQDMRGFRADIFTGGWNEANNPYHPHYQGLRDRWSESKTMIEGLAALWQNDTTRQQLVQLTTGPQIGDTSINPVIAILRGENGNPATCAFADALDALQGATIAFKTRKMIRAYIQNAALLIKHDASFMQYLRSIVPDFVLPAQQIIEVERAWRKAIERDFYNIGPALANYLIGDWLLWLWREGQIEWFESYKADSVFLKTMADTGKLPAEAVANFPSFCKGLYLADYVDGDLWVIQANYAIPPRVLNEAIWLEEASTNQISPQTASESHTVAVAIEHVQWPIRFHHLWSENAADDEHTTTETIRKAQRSDWDIQPMPTLSTMLQVEDMYTQEEFKHIALGLIPKEMEDRWFVFYEEPWLHLHRSWSGCCIYQVRFELGAEGMQIAEVRVNRDPDQYFQTDDEKDVASLKSLLGLIIIWHKQGPHFKIPPVLVHGVTELGNEEATTELQNANLSVQIFRDDDTGYLSWLAANPNGFVVNTYRKPKGNYLILHCSSCWCISRPLKNEEKWTAAFIKVCANDREALELWARDEVGDVLHPCGICF